jgi:GNAT superfamily N-acetyltransferase
LCDLLENLKFSPFDFGRGSIYPMIPPEPYIRPAVITDARAIAAVHISSWRAAYRGLMPDSVLDGLSIDKRERDWIDILGKHARHNLVLEQSGRIVGWASFGPARDADLDAQKVVELYGIYFIPGAWGRGLGRRLYEAVEKILSGKHAVVWVLEKNDRARNFYEALGFMIEPDRIKVIDREGAKLAEVRYQKELAR